MPESSSPHDSFSNLVNGFVDATDEKERTMYLRAALRSVQRDAELLTERLRLLTTASAAVKP